MGAPVTVTVLQAVNNGVSIIGSMTLQPVLQQGRWVHSFSVDYPRMVALVGRAWKLSLFDLERGEETTVLVPDVGQLDKVLLAFPLVLTTNDMAWNHWDVTVYNLVTGQEVGRTRLDHRPWSVSTNGSVVIVKHWGDGSTLLGLPGENGEEEMWRRVSECRNVACVINKTCGVRGRGNVVTVENYWTVSYTHLTLPTKA